MDTVTLPIKTLEKVEKQLVKTLDELRELKSKNATKNSKVVRFWVKKEWEEAERQADKDIKEGRVKSFSSMDDLIKDLNQA